MLLLLFFFFHVRYVLHQCIAVHTHNTVLSLFQHIGARRWRDRCMGCTAHRWWCHLFTRARLEPLEPVGPPTALVLLSTFQPLLSILHRFFVGPVASAFARWTDDTGNMAAAAHNKAHVATGKLRDPPGRLPGDDMILLGANRINVLANLPTVNRHPLQGNCIGLDQ